MNNEHHIWYNDKRSYWECRIVRTRTGKTVAKTISARKHGYERALEMVREARDEVMQDNEIYCEECRMYGENILEGRQKNRKAMLVIDWTPKPAVYAARQDVHKVYILAGITPMNFVPFGSAYTEGLV